MQELIGMRLRHKNLGEGVVLSCKEDWLTVKFDCGTVASLLFPDVFFGDLVAKDREDEAKINHAIETWKDKALGEGRGEIALYLSERVKEREREEEKRLLEEEQKKAERREKDMRIARLYDDVTKVTWKHVVTLVLACVGAFFALIGSILCLFRFLDLYAPIMGGVGTSQDANIYLSFYVILGFGGMALSLLGGLLVFFRKGLGKVCVILGLVMLLSLLIETCVMARGFELVMSTLVLLADVVLLPGAVFAMLAPTFSTEKLNAYLEENI